MCDTEMGINLFGSCILWWWRSSLHEKKRIVESTGRNNSIL